MRKYATILLIIILVLQGGGMLLLWRATRSLLVTTRSWNTDGDAYTVTLTRNSFRRQRMNMHEVMIGGAMHDIRHLTYSNEGVKLLVVRDTFEHELLKAVMQVAPGCENGALLMLCLLYIGSDLVTIPLLEITGLACWSPAHAAVTGSSPVPASPPPCA